MSQTLRSFRPVADERSRILILGSMPGTASLEKREYYGFAQNHFWKIVFEILETPDPGDYHARLAVLRERRIALWDVLRSCTREGSSDATIQSGVPNDIPRFLKKSPEIQTIFLNGGKAEAVYRRYFGDKIRIAAYRLPSTSPLNTVSYAKKLASWKAILNYLENRNPWC